MYVVYLKYPPDQGSYLAFLHEQAAWEIWKQRTSISSFVHNVIAITSVCIDA